MDAVDPRRLVPAAFARALVDGLSPPAHVVAAGKAAGPMFAVAARLVPGARGVIAAPVGEPPVTGDGVQFIAAGHPWPDAGSLRAGERALAIARDSAPAGGLLVLLSGGASAMLAAPAQGIELRDKIETSRALMESGAAIDELNCVRKHLSRIKGGRLAVAAGRTITLALSDVHAPIPDDPSVIGSGPTVPDRTSFADALAVIRARRAVVPRGVIEHLERGARGEIDETVKPGDPRVVSSTYVVVGNRHTAAAAARQAAEGLGYRVVTLDGATTGEARDTARAWVAAALRAAGPPACPACIIGSGETTVTVRGQGIGGRNQEFVLSAAADIASLGRALGRPVLLASAGTDGIDGPTDAAGAMVDQTSVGRARARGLDPEASLAGNDAYRFFEPLGDLIRWGPTGTNVGDLHVLLIA